MQIMLNWILLTREMGVSPNIVNTKLCSAIVGTDITVELKVIVTYRGFYTVIKRNLPKDVGESATGRYTYQLFPYQNKMLYKENTDVYNVADRMLG